MTVEGCRNVLYIIILEELWWREDVLFFGLFFVSLVRTLSSSKDDFIIPQYYLLIGLRVKYRTARTVIIMPREMWRVQQYGTSRLELAVQQQSNTTSVLYFRRVL